MGGMVTDDGQLGETAKTLHPALASQEVTTDVVALHRRGIAANGRFRLASQPSAGGAGSSAFGIENNSNIRPICGRSDHPAPHNLP